MGGLRRESSIQSTASTMDIAIETGNIPDHDNPAMGTDRDWLALQAAMGEQFRHTLSRDQVAVLNPDVHTPFRSSADAVARLFPYHVFSVVSPSEAVDIADAAKTSDALDALDAFDEYASLPVHTHTHPHRPMHKCKRKRSASFLSHHETIALLLRYAPFRKRCRNALVHADGGPERAQAAASMQLQLAHLSLEHERGCLAEELAELSARRVEYESWVRSNPRLRLTFPTPAALKTTHLPPVPTVAPLSLPSADALASAPPSTKLPGKSRGRKPKSNVAAILTASVSASGIGVHTPTNSSPVTPAGPGRAFPSSLGAEVTSSTHGPRISLTQIPLPWLTRLTQAGINPVPAPHLVPALTACRAQSGMQVGLHTAPRPSAPNQKDPAVLVGITEVVPPTAPSSPPVQILHLSFRWDKLSSPQLNTVVGLLRSIQQANAPASQNGNIQLSTVSTIGGAALSLSGANGSTRGTSE